MLCYVYSVICLPEDFLVTFVGKEFITSKNTIVAHCPLLNIQQHPTIIYMTIYKLGNRSIRAIFRSFRPWAKIRQYTEYHQNISKITACKLHKRKQDRLGDGRTAKPKSYKKLIANRSV